MSKKFVFVTSLLFSVLLNITACTSIPKVPVQGIFLDEEINTTVDSEIAKYYIESYLKGENGNPNLHDKISRLHTLHDNKPLSREDLKAISNQYSVDFAALFLAENLQKNELNKDIQKNFNLFLNDHQSTLLNLNHHKDRYIVLFVPGWDYKKNSHITGADFAVQRRLVSELKIENRLVEVPPTGSVEEIAVYLLNDISSYINTYKDIIIVGASSAGPAIHWVLAEKLENNHRSKIKAWLNIGGILQGSPLIDHYQQWPQNMLFNTIAWINDWNVENLYSLSADTSRKRYSNLDLLDENLKVINYLGLSLSGQLSELSIDTYPLLVTEGPNDGLTPLTDIVAPNSATIIATGSDHFFAEDPRINEKTIALLKVVISQIENKI